MSPWERDRAIDGRAIPRELSGGARSTPVGAMRDGHPTSIRALPSLLQEKLTNLLYCIFSCGLIVFQMMTEHLPGWLINVERMVGTGIDNHGNRCAFSPTSGNHRAAACNWAPII